MPLNLSNRDQNSGHLFYNRRLRAAITRFSVRMKHDDRKQQAAVALSIVLVLIGVGWMALLHFMKPAGLVGESAIIGHAIADPVSSQLQRVFGVTQLHINPTFATGSQLPATQFSLQQQVSNNLTFTYVTGLNTANAETIQVLWTFTPQWSAQALRDYNGIFSVTLQYRRQIR